MTRAATPGTPLFQWPEERAIILLETARQELRGRIARLKPRSHARIIAEAELRHLTRQALRAETTSRST